MSAVFCSSAAASARTPASPTRLFPRLSTCRWISGSFLGSLSAGSTAKIATKYSFFQVFRDLQDFHTFAPLRSQKFSEKPSKFLLEFFRFFRVFRWKFAIFLQKFDEILPEFRRNVEEMTKKVDTPKRLRKAEKINLFERLEKAKRLGKD